MLVGFYYDTSKGDPSRIFVLLPARAFFSHFVLAQNTDKKYQKSIFFENILSEPFQNVTSFTWLIHIQDFIFFHLGLYVQDRGQDG